MTSPNTHRPFIECRERTRWKKLLAQLGDSLNFEWLRINEFHQQVQPHASEEKI
ncbi:hypothetical protein HCUR_00592 [Holospora curviuscula]|uniref:Uncharacterized protein n=1 Tax=Holospora curviuscula TaxID=1082868 RepID=A0A2S5R9T0_9PROT|nr:hypothetical protein HCUR_00592 [Holospora curviuscula]